MGDSSLTPLFEAMAGDFDFRDRWAYMCRSCGRCYGPYDYPASTFDDCDCDDTVEIEAHDSAAQAATPPAAAAEAVEPGAPLTPSDGAPGPAFSGLGPGVRVTLGRLQRMSSAYEGFKAMGVPAELAGQLVTMLEDSTASDLHKLAAVWSTVQNRVVGKDSLAEWLHSIGYRLGRARKDIAEHVEPQRATHEGDEPFQCSTCPRWVKPGHGFVLVARTDGTRFPACLRCKP